MYTVRIDTYSLKESMITHFLFMDGNFFTQETVLLLDTL